MAPARERIEVPEYVGKRIISNAGKELREQAGNAFDDILGDVERAYKLHSQRLNQLRKSIGNLKPAERAYQINKVSQQMEAWIEARDRRWSNLGTKLGTIIRKGVRAWVGL